MDILLPRTFIELLGGLIAIFALIAGILSLWPLMRSHSIRLLALFFVGALSLFSNHWITYFAGIFVIATAVTKLEFLQNLAAIIRGSKPYFDYKKNILSAEQKTRKVAQEQLAPIRSNISEGAEISAAPELRGVMSKVAKPNIRRILDLESKVLDRMEEYFKDTIERGVRISGGDNHIELDGLIQSTNIDIFADTIIEVKYLSNPSSFGRIVRMFTGIERLVRTYSAITNRLAALHFVLIIEGRESLSEPQFERLKTMIDLSIYSTGYNVFTTSDLGDD